MLIVAGTIAKPPPAASTASTRQVPDSPLPESTETEALRQATTSDESGTALDFSGCDSMTGLDNAICRHEALLKVKSDNPGLTNSVAHLQANRAAQADRKAAKDAGTHGKSGARTAPRGRSSSRQSRRLSTEIA